MVQQTRKSNVIVKNLFDYIELTQLDQIDESILCHLAIDYKVNDIGTGRNIINEKYGIYGGCEELADYITNDIFSNNCLDNEYRYSGDELSNINNIFFKELIVDLDTSADTGGECDDTITINKDLLVDAVFINLYLTAPTKAQVKGILMHELTHLYNNYIMQIKGNTNYIKAANSELYRNVTLMSGGTTERDIKQVLYFLIGYERNAFVAQLKAELDDNKSKIKTPLDALKILKQCPIYRAYVRVNNIIQYYSNKQEENPESELIANIYKQITGNTNSNETSAKILKRLKTQANKALKKLDSVIPKLCVENLNNTKWRREIFPI